MYMMSEFLDTENNDPTKYPQNTSLYLFYCLLIFFFTPALSYDMKVMIHILFFINIVFCVPQ